MADRCLTISLADGCGAGRRRCCCALKTSQLATRLNGCRRCWPAWSCSRPSSISCSGCTSRSGGSPRCASSFGSCRPPRCWRFRCWFSTTCCCRRISTARSSSARSPSPFISSSRPRCSAARASPTGISARRARSAAPARSMRSRPCSSARAADVEVPLRADRERRDHPRSSRSASCRRRGRIRASRCAACRCSADSTISRTWSRCCGRARCRCRALVLTPSAFEPDSGAESILIRARRLGLTVNRLPSLDESGRTLQLAPVAVEDLLLRPSVKIDYGRLEAFLQRQVRRRHRRRRFDRRGNLRPRGDLRRGAPADHRELGARALCRAGGSGGQAAADPRSTAGWPMSATASASFGC